MKSAYTFTAKATGYPVPSFSNWSRRLSNLNSIYKTEDEKRDVIANFQSEKV